MQDSFTSTGFLPCYVCTVITGYYGATSHLSYERKAFTLPSTVGLLYRVTVLRNFLYGVFALSHIHSSFMKPLTTTSIKRVFRNTYFKYE